MAKKYVNFRVGGTPQKETEDYTVWTNDLPSAQHKFVRGMVKLAFPPLIEVVGNFFAHRWGVWRHLFV